MKVGNAIFGNLHLSVGIGLELIDIKVLHIEVGVHCVCVDAKVKEHTCKAHGLARHVSETESARIGNHACVNIACGLGVDLKLPAEAVIEICNHLAGRGSLLLNPHKVAIGSNIDVVVDLDNLTAEVELLIGDTLHSAGVHNNSEGVGIGLIGKKLVLTAKECHVVCKVAVLELDLLLGEGQLENTLKTLGRACCVTVGTLVTEDENPVVLLDLVKYLLFYFVILVFHITFPLSVQ